MLRQSTGRTSKVGGLVLVVLVVAIMTLQIPSVSGSAHAASPGLTHEVVLGAPSTTASNRLALAAASLADGEGPAAGTTSTCGQAVGSTVYCQGLIFPHFSGGLPAEFPAR